MLQGRASQALFGAALPGMRRSFWPARAIWHLPAAYRGCNHRGRHGPTVIDTTAMVAATRSDAGASRRLLVAGLRWRLTLLASLPLMIEYQAVMTRPDHLKAFGLTMKEVNSVLDAVAVVIEPVQLTFLWRPSLRAPDDDMVLEAAVNGQADLIVTFNIRDFDLVAADVGIEVLAPGETWRRLKAR